LGTVFGFLLIEEKDENTLVALQVTPLPMRGFLLYRMGIAFVLSFVVVLISLPLTGLVSLSWPLVLVTLATAPIAPLIAILYATFAENKVQGFGFLKAIGTLNIIPIAAYFVALPWQYLIGVVYPFYWPVKAFWEMDRPIYLVYVAISFLVHLGLIAVMLRRFQQVVNRA
jgi:fluoroquinolone transport system permease protein